MNPDVEEERRLFYVACSRPRKQLFVSWFFYGSDMEKLNEGMFIKELLGKDKVLEMKNHCSVAQQKSTNITLVKTKVLQIK